MAGGRVRQLPRADAGYARRRPSGRGPRSDRAGALAVRGTAAGRAAVRSGAGGSAGGDRHRTGADWAPWQRTADPDAGTAAQAQSVPDRPEPAGDQTSEPTAPDETPRSSEAAAAHALEAEVASPRGPAQPADDVPPVAADETASAAPAPHRRTKKGKPVMPSWDEVLLGVRGPR